MFDDSEITIGLCLIVRNNATNQLFHGSGTYEELSWLTLHRPKQEPLEPKERKVQIRAEG